MQRLIEIFSASPEKLRPSVSFFWAITPANLAKFIEMPDDEYMPCGKGVTFVAEIDKKNGSVALEHFSPKDCWDLKPLIRMLMSKKTEKNDMSAGI